jgi:hypothetical protein
MRETGLKQIISERFPKAVMSSRGRSIDPFPLQIQYKL